MVKFNSNITETYKYSPFEILLSKDSFPTTAKPKESPRKNFQFLAANNACELDVIDGFLLKNSTSLPDGIEISQEQNPPFEPENNDPVVCQNLNNPNTETFTIRIDKRFNPSQPIIIHNYATATNSLSITRFSLIIEEHARAQIIIRNQLNQNCFANELSQILLKENAALEFIKIQADNNADSQLFSNCIVSQQTNSSMKSYIFSAANNFIRNQLTVHLNGEHAEHISKGFALVAGEQHLDNHINIIHHHPNCNSNQLYKHILNANAKSAFTGCIIVQPDAQKTQAYQRSNNILLSENAKMDVRPQLIINADDVKCSHGATIGQVDNNALFYLLSRGVPRKDAMKMLMKSFLAETFSDLASNIKDIISEYTDSQLYKLF